MAGKYLVVGGSSGIGLELVKELVANGNEVLVVSRTGDLIRDLDHVTHIAHDLLIDEPLNLELDSLEGIAYCPGTINLKPFHRLKQSDFEQDFRLNVLGAIKSVQAALPALKKGVSPSILLFSTVAVGQGMGFHASVATSKGAIEGLTRSLAAELAPKIRVNCIAPSAVDTPLATRIFSSEEKKEASAKRHPLAKYGMPKDIAPMAAFLLSEKASWITGQILGIDGGMSSIKMF